MMMIVAARREITRPIQSGFRAGVNVNSVQNLCAKGGQMKNFWGFSGKSADNPVTSKIPLDLRY
jgi:ribosomal protein L23